MTRLPLLPAIVRNPGARGGHSVGAGCRDPCRQAPTHFPDTRGQVPRRRPVAEYPSSAGAHAQRMNRRPAAHDHGDPSNPALRQSSC
jgi:hypothetical protein